MSRLTEEVIELQHVSLCEKLNLKGYLELSLVELSGKGSLAYNFPFHMFPGSKALGLDLVIHSLLSTMHYYSNNKVEVIKLSY